MTVRKWLVFVLVVQLAVSLVCAALLVRADRSYSYVKAFEKTSIVSVLHRFWPWYFDSWRPMVIAYEKKTADPSQEMYRIFFEEKVKFQYPPSALLMFDFFPRDLVRSTADGIYVPLRKILDGVSRASLAFTILISALLLEFGSNGFGRKGWQQRKFWSFRRLLLSVILGAIFFPLVVANEIGQIQVFLNAATALAIFFYLLGFKRLAGACLGLCCLVKPQYFLIGLWAAARREGKMLLGFLAVLVPGILISINRFGFQDHWQYLDVLKAISRTGESYWFNQSVNGLLNRFLENGSPYSLNGPTDFAPHHPLVYVVTLITSAALVLAALWPSRAASPKARAADFLVAVAVSTMASPVAWNHHYGAFFAIFLVVLVFAQDLETRRRGLFIGAWAVSYVLMAATWLQPESFFWNRWLGLAGSHLFYGAMVLLILLFRMRSHE